MQRNLPIDTECTSVERVRRDTCRKTCHNDNKNSSKFGILRKKDDGRRHSILSSEDLDFCFKKCSDSCDEEIKTPRSGKSVAFGESVTVEVIDDEIGKSDDEPNPAHKEANKISKNNKREPVIDKFGRVDGYSERRLFMGKGARMKEQLYIQNKTSKLNPEFQNEEEIVKKPKTVVTTSSRAGNSESSITKELRQRRENNFLDRGQKIRTIIGEDIDNPVEEVKTSPQKSNSKNPFLEQNSLDKNSTVINSVETSNSSSSVVKFVKETSTIEAIENKVCGFKQIEDRESSSCEKDIETVQRQSKIESMPQEDNFDTGPFYLLNLEKKIVRQDLMVENSELGGDIETGLQASQRVPPGFEIQYMNPDYGYRNSNYHSECQIYQNNTDKQISSNYSYNPGYYDMPKHVQIPHTEHTYHENYNDNHSAHFHCGEARCEEANERGSPPQINYAKSLRAPINAEKKTNRFMTTQPVPGFIKNLRLPPGFTNCKGDISERNFRSEAVSPGATQRVINNDAVNVKTQDEKSKAENIGENDRKVDINRNFNFGGNSIPLNNCAADRSKPVDDNTGMNFIRQTTNDNYFTMPGFYPTGMCSTSLQNTEYIPRYPTTTHCHIPDQYSAGSYEVSKWQFNPNFMNSPEFRASSMSEYSPPMPNRFGSSISPNPVFPPSMIESLSYTDYNFNQPTQISESSADMFSNVEVGRGRGRLTRRDLM